MKKIIFNPVVLVMASLILPLLAYGAETANLHGFAMALFIAFAATMAVLVIRK
ncbi:MAG: hypothetical protein ABID63_06805 [Pseudomonadota bacterium]